MFSLHEQLSPWACIQHIQSTVQYFIAFDLIFSEEVCSRWGYSSVAEHSTADREVPGSNPGAPCFFFIHFSLSKRKQFSCTFPLVAQYFSRDFIIHRDQRTHTTFKHSHEITRTFYMRLRYANTRVTRLTLSLH